MTIKSASGTMAAHLAGLLVSVSLSTAAFAGGPDLANGQERYEETCIACHGDNGKGTMPGIPNFASAKGPFAKTDAELTTSIIEGLESPGADLAMPAMGGNPDLTEDDVRDLIAYMRKAFTK